MWETWVQSLGREDPLEKKMAPHSSILAWRIPWTEEPGGLQPMGSQRVGHEWVTSLSLSLCCERKNLCLITSHFFIFVFKIRLGKEGCNWVLISPQLDGTHFISLYGILSSWFTDSVSLLPPSFWIFQTLRGKSGFSILLVIQDDGMGVSSTKLPTRLASSRR